MFNSVNGNVSNEVLIQKNELKNNRISYRGKATNSLEKFPAQDEIQKKENKKGGKILLGTLGLAGVAVAIDKIFLKGKYTDEILKNLKKNSDDALKGTKKTADDVGRAAGEGAEVTATEIEKMAADADIILSKGGKITEKSDDVLSELVDEQPAIVVRTVVPDEIVNPKVNNKPSTLDIFTEVLSSKNTKTIDVIDTPTTKVVTELGDNVLEVKPIEETDDILKRGIKELEETAKRQKEAQRIEQENVDMAVMAFLADDALKQSLKTKTDDVLAGVKNKVDDVVEDGISVLRKDADNALEDLHIETKVDDAVSELYSPVHVDDITGFNPSSHPYYNDGLVDLAGYHSPLGDEIPGLHNNPTGFVDDLTSFHTPDPVDTGLDFGSGFLDDGFGLF